MLRRKRSNTARKSDCENEQAERLLNEDSEEILVGKRRELDLEYKLEDYEEDKGGGENAEDEYGSEEFEEEQDDGDEADKEAREIEDLELKEELEEWGEDHNRLGEEMRSKTKKGKTNSVEAPPDHRVVKMERPFNVWRW